MKTTQLPCSSATGLWALLHLLMLLVLLAHPARAQFPTVASQTLFVCSAPGVQVGVEAFADGAGGAYSVWIDKRGGNNSGPGTALYAQHLDANGTALLPANGLRLFQTRGKEIWGVRAIRWQSGILVAWVQGAFGIGGDTVRCQYYSAAGVPQWAAPTVVAYRTLPTVIYELQYGLNIFPITTGATIVNDLTLNGGGDWLTFNQVSFTGALRFANNQIQRALPSANSLLTLSDGGDGLYVVSSYGGLGSAIYAQHYDVNGVGWANDLNLNATGANGRGNQNWRAVRDPAGNLYVVWGSNSGNIIGAQVTPGGALGWAAPGYRILCTNPSYQSVPDALWHNNALWAVWNDDRTGVNSPTTYIQKADAAGTLAWPGAGVLVNSLPAYSPEPRLAPSDNGAVMALYITNYSAGTGLRAQKIRPDASLAFPAGGVALHTADPDRAASQDLVPVAQPNGAVQVFWASAGSTPAGTGQDICAGRVQNSGSLLGTERAAGALGFAVYPNPATSELNLQFPIATKPTSLRLYDGQGRLVRAFAGATESLPLRGLPVGLYVLRATLAGQQVSRRVMVE
ncbi:T9SS type A sorting domain-containing protein [Hymenobacter sp. UYCo722]|uniref:T9SS type A sorting domain-containing protein n=1 Tax=Hymenobacter sp. UYCo722 TaxID=3156335 RepID=UPI0033992F17